MFEILINNIIPFVIILTILVFVHELGHYSRISTLNLENNKLGDSNIKIILNSMVYQNKSIRILNISNNFLTEQVADGLKEVMSRNLYLNELYLHWNNLKANGVFIDLD